MTLLRLAAAAVGIGLLAGCSKPGGASAPPETSLLQDVNQLLRAAGTPDRLPAKLADLNRHQHMFPRGYEVVKTGDVVVIWGAPALGEGDVGKNEAVVAYEKNVPTEGGYVLLSAGSVKKMSAAEFAAAPKAGKK